MKALPASILSWKNDFNTSVTIEVKRVVGLELARDWEGWRTTVRR